MTVDDLKSRTIKILRAADPTHFDDVIPAINAIKLHGLMGFDNLHAKVQILNLALDAIFENHFYQHASDLAKKILRTLCDDEMSAVKFDKLLSGVPANRQTETASVATYHLSVLEKYHRSLQAFLNVASHLKTTYDHRFVKSLLKPLLKNNSSLYPLQINIEQDDAAQTIVLQKSMVIRIAGLVGNIAISLVGTRADGNTVVSVGRFSTSDEETILTMKENFSQQQHIDLAEIKISIVGGCLSTLPHNLALIMQPDLGITDFRLCLTEDNPSSPDEKFQHSAVMIMGDQPSTIYYSSDESIVDNQLKHSAQSLSKFWSAGESADTVSDKNDIQPTPYLPLKR